RKLVLAGPPHTTIPRRVVWNPLKSERLTQLRMLVQAHLRLARGPVLVAHEAQDRQQSGLGERMCGARAAIAGQRCFGALVCHLSKADDANLGHGDTSTPPLCTRRARMSTRPDDL